jgi:hypothetical protein
VSDESAASEDPGKDERRAARSLLDAAREPQGEGRSGDEAGLAAVEAALMRAEGREKPDPETVVMLLHAKCRYLSDADRLDEALTVCEHEIDVAQELAEESGTGKTAQLGTEAYLVRASILGRLDRPKEALETATAVQEVIEADEDPDESPTFRSLAVWASDLRMQQLIKLRRFDEATKAWASLLDHYGGDPEAPIRGLVALGGAVAAAYLENQKERKRALALADEVVARFGSTDEPKARPGVALALAVRAASLRARGRMVATVRASSDLLTFLGPDPEPEVIRTMRSVPNGERMLRLAHWSESS